MQEFTKSTGTRALTRTFNVLTVDREFGVVTDVTTSTVILTRTAAGLVAEVNGQSASMDSAVRLLEQAQRVWLMSEVLMPVEVAAPIGNAVARLLHVEFGRLGYRTSLSHYDLATSALGRGVTSLAALTAEEAQITRSYAYGQLGLEMGSVAA